jgi:hypothetical protein
MCTQSDDVKRKVRELWQAEKIELFSASAVDPVLLLKKVYDMEPPDKIQEYYRCVPGGTAFGCPLIGVNFVQPGTSIIEGLETFAPMVNRNFWPLAGDGCGNYYVGFMIGEKLAVGFVDVLKDDYRPDRVVASSIVKLLEGLESQVDQRSEWPWGEAVENLDPEQATLDKLYQAQKMT